MVTEEQAEQEIDALNKSPFVQLARKAQRNRYMVQQRLYQLRWLEKHGRELADAGLTMDILRAQAASLRADMKDDDPDEDATW